jgi:hypothetical protein
MTDTEMPDMFDRLTAQAQRWADKNTEPPEFELSSDRELSRTDAAHRVQVTMKDFKIASVHIDDTWYAEWLPSLLEIEQAVRDAVNATLGEYWAQELQDAKDHRTPMGEIASGLQELSVEFRGAFEMAVARLDAHA